MRRHAGPHGARHGHGQRPKGRISPHARRRGHHGRPEHRSGPHGPGRPLSARMRADRALRGPGTGRLRRQDPAGRTPHGRLRRRSHRRRRPRALPPLHESQQPPAPAAHRPTRGRRPGRCGPLRAVRRRAFRRGGCRMVRSRSRYGRARRHAPHAHRRCGPHVRRAHAAFGPLRSGAPAFRQGLRERYRGLFQRRTLAARHQLRGGFLGALRATPATHPTACP